MSLVVALCLIAGLLAALLVVAVGILSAVRGRRCQTCDAALHPEEESLCSRCFYKRVESEIDADA